jgi:hypothetical protein
LSTDRRVLFLDDDPKRAVEFLSVNPDAIWVETAVDCIKALHEPWDQVHLDHDLGGEHYVDHDRDDCGMAVIRWLCEEPRVHLQPAMFVIHTHNAGAAIAMIFQLEAMGYTVQERRFGTAASSRDDARPDWMARVGDFLGQLLGRR